MRIRLKLLTAGLFCIVMIRNENTDSNSQFDCEIEEFAANCSSRGIFTIPQTLDTKIVDLDVSNNPISNVRRNFFERYKGLLKLTMRRLNPTPYKISIESDAFACMTNLNYLDMSESPFDVKSTAEINWPTKLGNISIGSLEPFKFSKLNLSGLPLLQKLNVSYHNLEDLPELHMEAHARIGWIDLYDNPVTNLTAERLAPICHLSYLRLGSIRNATEKLSSEQYSCQCRRLRRWMTKFNILGFNISCYKPNFDEQDTCAVGNFSDTMINQRDACLAEPPMSWLWRVLLVLMLLCLSLPIVYISHRACISYRMKKKTDDDPFERTSELDVTPAPSPSSTTSNTTASPKISTPKPKTKRPKSKMTRARVRIYRR